MKFKFLFLILLIILSCSFVFGDFSGGGTSNNPYQITTCGQLTGMSSYLEKSDVYFKLMNDLDCTGEYFHPIGTSGSKFKGHFNGNGKIIYNLEFDSNDMEYVGFFGYTSGAEIYNFGLVNSFFRGKNYVGSIAGYFGSGSEARRVFAIGEVYISGKAGGGLFGQVRDGSDVYDSYANVLVYSSLSTAEAIGGLIGMQGSTCEIQNSYSAGFIDERSSKTTIGGFIGDGMSNSKVINSFWDTQTSATITSDGGTGKTTTQMKTPLTFTLAGWRPAIWEFCGGYPVLQFQNWCPDTTSSVISIRTCNDLQGISNGLDKSYVLENDLNCPSHTTIFGTFAGVLNGQGYEISGLQNPLFFNVVGKISNLNLNVNIHKEQSVSYGSLIGGAVANLQTGGIIENSSVIGSIYYKNTGKNPINVNVGGFFGNQGGAIKNCFSNISVISVGDYAYGGGFSGFQLNSGSSIINSYSVGSIEGVASSSGGCKIGGLVGESHLTLGQITITKSYSLSPVTCSGTGGNKYPAGLVSWACLAKNTTMYGQYYNNNYWNFVGGTYGTLRINGGDTAANIVSSTPVTSFKLQSTFSGWDFTSTWELCNNKYPTLRWQDACNVGQSTEICDNVDKDSDGYYEICSCDGLQDMKFNLARNYELVKDIDCSNSSTWNLGEGFIPIGSSSTVKFTGNFNGNGKRIYNLTINRPTMDYVGLFGENDGSIDFVKIVNSKIIGKDYVGGLVGKNNGDILRSAFSGNVSGQNNVGGLVGENRFGDIRQSLSLGKVNGINYVGGLVGSSQMDVSNSYSKSNAQGTTGVGGLVGSANFLGGGNILNTYSSGLVQGTNLLGGLVGLSNMPQYISNSFYDNLISGQNDIDKGIPKITSLMKSRKTFTSAGWLFNSIWQICYNSTPTLRWEGPCCTPATVYYDFDSDGYGNSSRFLLNQCRENPPKNYVLNGDDCDDYDSLTYPFATEACDGKDNDCNAETLEDDICPVFCTPNKFYFPMAENTDVCDYGVDLDDSFSSWTDLHYETAHCMIALGKNLSYTNIPNSCEGFGVEVEGINSYLINGKTCRLIFGGMQGIPENMACYPMSFVDDYESSWYFKFNCGSGEKTYTWSEGYRKIDMYRNVIPFEFDLFTEPTGYNHTKIYPYLCAEYCYLDADGDNYTDGTFYRSSECTLPNYYSSDDLEDINLIDCDDSNPDINPGLIWYQDKDDDGYYYDYVTQCLSPCNPNAAFVDSCITGPDEWISSLIYTPPFNGEDCDDENYLVNGGTIWYNDFDGDLFYNESIISCSEPGEGFKYDLRQLLGGGDCDNNNGLIFSMAFDSCNWVDENCDGLIDVMNGKSTCSQKRQLIPIASLFTLHDNYFYISGEDASIMNYVFTNPTTVYLSAGETKTLKYRVYSESPIMLNNTLHFSISRDGLVIAKSNALEVRTE